MLTVSTDPVLVESASYLSTHNLVLVVVYSMEDKVNSHIIHAKPLTRLHTTPGCRARQPNSGGKW